MNKTHLSKTAAIVLITATSFFGLSACSTKNTQADPQATYVQQKEQIPHMVKKFSAPNLSVLLNSMRLENTTPTVMDAQTLGTARNVEHNAVELLKTASFNPEECQSKLLNTYKDDTDIPAAYSQKNASADSPVLKRIQLRAFPTTEAASTAISSQKDLAASCPEFQVAVTEKDHTTYRIESMDYDLEDASDGLQVKSTVTDSSGAQYTSIGIFQRIGNLELRVYFDSQDPTDQPQKSKKDIQDFVKLLGKALISKSE